MRLLPLLLLTACVVGCAGFKAREHALQPAARKAWPDVRTDTERGIADGVEDGDLGPELAAQLDRRIKSVTNAIESTYDPSLFRLAEWWRLEPWAMRGVQDQLDDGELGPNGAASLRERVHNFTEAMQLLEGKQ